MSSQPAEVDKFREEYPGGPSLGVRTAISLFLFFHLFALFVTFAGNFGVRGSYALSGLRRKLHENTGLRYYLQLLDMDTSYANAMIYNTVEDFDHSIDILLDTPTSIGLEPEDFAKLEKIELMPAGAWPGARRRRFWMLALNTALNEGNQDLEPILPYALANGMFHAHGTEDGTHLFRCRAQRPMSRGEYEAEDPALRDPNHRSYFFSVYEASLLKSGDTLGLSKQESSGEMTQSRRTRPGN